METLRPALPAWFRIGRWACLIGLVLAYVGWGAGSLGLTLVKVLVYRDFGKYRFVGDPWSSGGLPWYVAWGYRLTEIVAGVTLLAGLFWVFYVGWRVVFLLAFPLRTRTSVNGRITGASLLSLLTMLALAAWLGRWFG